MPDTLHNRIYELAARVEALEAGLRIDPAVISIAENSPSNIMLLDRSGCIEYINRTVPDLTKEQVIGTPVFNYVGAEFHARIREAFERSRLTGQPDRYETWYVAENGDTSWWESSVGPVLRDGEVVGFAVISTNVTEQRKQAEHQERFFNLSVDMLCVADFDGYFRRVNPAFEATLGLGRELLDRPFIDFVHPEDVPTTKQVFEDLVTGKRLTDFTNRYRTRDGSYRWLSWRIAVDRDRRTIYSVARDVTEQRTLERRLRQSQKLDAVGKLAGGVAHDFNNLLLAIMGNIELATEAERTDARELLGDAMDAARTAARLTQQLLAFSKRQAIAPAPLDLGALLQDMSTLLRRLLPKNIDLVLSIATGSDASTARAIGDGAASVGVLADRSQLEQVVLNLSVNARDAMPKGGRLEIRVEPISIDERFAQENPWAQPGRYVMLSVRDSGEGISLEAREHLFEPFFTTKGPGQGSGLGLATVYGIVQQHRGLINVQSSPGRGSTFQVLIPATDERPERSSDEPESFAVGGHETILVAEDDAMVRHSVVQTLRRAGYEVLVAEDGVQAVSLFNQNAQRISLVMLDVMMPNLNGPNAARLIREQGPQVQLLFTSGHAGKELDDDDLADAPLLPKPYRRGELLRRVREALDARAEPTVRPAD